MNNDYNRDEAFLGFDGEFKLATVFDETSDDFWEIEQTYGHGDPDGTTTHDE